MNQSQSIFAHSRITRALAYAMAAMLVVAITVHRVEAASGDLDTSFGAGGIVTTDPDENANTSEEGRAVAVQKDGRIVVGANHRLQTGAGDFVLTRYNTDGTLDGSFGVGGVVKTDFLGYGGMVNSVKIDAKGRIVAAGLIATSSSATAFWDMAMVRYTASGALDTTFGTQGKVTLNNSINDNLSAIAIQKDGKIVATGTSYGPQPGEDFTTFRLTTSGALDPTFAGGNFVFTDFNSPSAQAAAIAIQTDGRIVVGGYAYANGKVFGLVRYNSNGTLDSSFGAHGKVTTRLPDPPDNGSDDYLCDLLIRPVPLSPSGAEQIIAAGYRYTYPNSYAGAMVCYQPDGTLNSAFGSGGIVITNFSSNERVYCAVRQADGKLILGGVSRDANNNSHFTLMRFNGNGSPDTNFGQGGRVITPIGGVSEIWEMALTPQGGLVAAGWSAGTNRDITIARYLP
jgi:uncharacterized delta-60 repeat protein